MVASLDSMEVVISLAFKKVATAEITELVIAKISQLLATVEVTMMATTTATAINIAAEVFADPRG